MTIQCNYRFMSGQQPVCQIVSDLMDRPLPECHTNDSACRYCQQCGVAPQIPNAATASMAVGVASRTKDRTFLTETIRRFKKHFGRAAAVTTCVLRGRETRQVDCKPCQADSLTPVKIPVFSCPKHQECTLHNTSTFPKIQACATCGDRLEKYYELDAKPLPAAVLAAIPRRGPSTF